MLMLLIRAVLLITVVVQTSVVVSGPLLADTKVTVGAPEAPPEVAPYYEFTLKSGDKTKTFKVTGIGKGITAEDKAKKIATVVARDGGGDWIAVRDGAELSFRFVPPGIATPLKTAEISDVHDTTREPDVLAISSPQGGIYAFGLGGEFASGTTFTGEASILSLATTGGFSTVPLTSGLSASFIIDLVFADLMSDGVSLERLSPTAFQIFQPDASSFLSYEMVDTSLFIKGVGAREVPEPGTATLLTISIVVFGIEWLRTARKKHGA